MTSIEKQLFNATDAMQYLGIKSTATFYKLVGMGLIPVVQPCPKIRPQYWIKDLDNYIRNNRHTLGINISIKAG